MTAQKGAWGYGGGLARLILVAPRGHTKSQPKFTNVRPNAQISQSAVKNSD